MPGFPPQPRRTPQTINVSLSRSARKHPAAYCGVVDRSYQKQRLFPACEAPSGELRIGRWLSARPSPPPSRGLSSRSS
jgi:hypothetical protein